MKRILTIISVAAAFVAGAGLTVWQSQKLASGQLRADTRARASYACESWCGMCGYTYIPCGTHCPSQAECGGCGTSDCRGADAVAAAPDTATGTASEPTRNSNGRLSNDAGYTDPGSNKVNKTNDQASSTTQTIADTVNAEIERQEQEAAAAAAEETTAAEAGATKQFCVPDSSKPASDPYTCYRVATTLSKETVVALLCGDGKRFTIDQCNNSDTMFRDGTGIITAQAVGNTTKIGEIQTLSFVQNDYIKAQITLNDRLDRVVAALNSETPIDNNAVAELSAELTGIQAEANRTLNNCPPPLCDTSNPLADLTSRINNVQIALQPTAVAPIDTSGTGGTPPTITTQPSQVIQPSELIYESGRASSLIAETQKLLGEKEALIEYMRDNPTNTTGAIVDRINDIDTQLETITTQAQSLSPLLSQRTIENITQFRKESDEKIETFVPNTALRVPRSQRDTSVDTTYTPPEAQLSGDNYDPLDSIRPQSPDLSQNTRQAFGEQTNPIIARLLTPYLNIIYEQGASEGKTPAEISDQLDIFVNNNTILGPLWRSLPQPLISAIQRTVAQTENNFREKQQPMTVVEDQSQITPTIDNKDFTDDGSGSFTPPDTSELTIVIDSDEAIFTSQDDIGIDINDDYLKALAQAATELGFNAYNIPTLPSFFGLGTALHRVLINSFNLQFLQNLQFASGSNINTILEVDRGGSNASTGFTPELNVAYIMYRDNQPINPDLVNEELAQAITYDQALNVIWLQRDSNPEYKQFLTANGITTIEQLDAALTLPTSNLLQQEGIQSLRVVYEVVQTYLMNRANEILETQGKPQITIGGSYDLYRFSVTYEYGAYPYNGSETDNILRNAAKTLNIPTIDTPEELAKLLFGQEVNGHTIAEAANITRIIGMARDIGADHEVNIQPVSYAELQSIQQQTVVVAEGQTSSAETSGQCSTGNRDFICGLVPILKPGDIGKLIWIPPEVYNSALNTAGRVLKQAPVAENFVAHLYLNNVLANFEMQENVEPPTFTISKQDIETQQTLDQVSLLRIVNNNDINLPYDAPTELLTMEDVIIIESLLINLPDSFTHYEYNDQPLQIILYPGIGGGYVNSTNPGVINIGLPGCDQEYYQNPSVSCGYQISLTIHEESHLLDGVNNQQEINAGSLCDNSCLPLEAFQSASGTDGIHFSTESRESSVEDPENDLFLFNASAEPGNGYNTNPREGFAIMSAGYYLAGEEMKERYPATYQFFKQCVYDNNEYTVNSQGEVVSSHDDHGGSCSDITIGN